jgi:hypothetical protein
MIAIPSPPLNYIEYAIGFLFVIFLDYALGIHKLLLAHRKFYFYFSYASLVAIIIGIFGGLDYTGNILLIRALNAGNSGHLISWIAIVMVACRFGYNDILKGITAAGGFAAGHEIISVSVTLITGAYGASLGITLSQALWYYSTFIVLLGAMMAAYFWFTESEYFKDLFKAMIVLTLASIIVASIGAVGTLNLIGPTQYFDNLDYNLVEQINWIIPAIVFVGLSLVPREKDLNAGVFE